MLRTTCLICGLASLLLTAGCMMDEVPLEDELEDPGFGTCTGLGEEGCECEDGQVASCYSDGPNENGECLEGNRYCEDGAWSECDFTNAGVLPIIGDPELCGGCDPACFRQHTCPTGRDLTEDNAENVRFDLDRDGLVLGGRTVSARYAYIANSGENTVSKIDLGTRVEVGRYYVGGSPSRTAVDSRGNCLVAMRSEHHQNVAKIAGDQSYCVDRNRNGRIDTSGGSNVLSRGTDECVIWWSTAAVGACPRAVAIDRRDRVWIGGWCIRNFYVLNSDTGSLIRTVGINASAYGAAIDSNGMLWYSGRSHGWLQNVNTETYAVGPVRGTGCGGDLYGIMVDLEDRPWIVCAHRGCRASRFTPHGARWDNVCTIPVPRTARGITIDSSGDVWIATHHNWGWNYGQGYGYRFDPESRAQEAVYRINGCDGAIGVASDFEDNIWFACHGSWTGSMLDPDTGDVTNVRVGRYPYTYSDFTGFCAPRSPLPRAPTSSSSTRTWCATTTLLWCGRSCTSRRRLPRTRGSTSTAGRRGASRRWAAHARCCWARCPATRSPWTCKARWRRWAWPTDSVTSRSACSCSRSTARHRRCSATWIWSTTA